jgi:hypothetical protein
MLPSGGTVFDYYVVLDDPEAEAYTRPLLTST